MGCVLGAGGVYQFCVGMGGALSHRGSFRWPQTRTLFCNRILNQGRLARRGSGIGVAAVGGYDGPTYFNDLWFVHGFFGCGFQFSDPRSAALIPINAGVSALGNVLSIN